MANKLSVRKDTPMSPFNVPNAGRTFAQGLTFGFSDEMEAAIRAAAQGDPARYRAIVNQIRAQQERYAKDNPKAAFGLEMTGILGGALATPQVAAAKALGPLGRFLVGGAEDAAQGALYAAGQAKDIRDIPRSIKEEAPVNAAFYTGAAGVGAGAKAAGRAAAKPILSTQRGYNTALKLQQLLSKLGR